MTNPAGWSRSTLSWWMCSHLFGLQTIMKRKCKIDIIEYFVFTRLIRTAPFTSPNNNSHLISSLHWLHMWLTRTNDFTRLLCELTVKNRPRCTLPSLFLFQLVFCSVCCLSLSFKSSLHQRFSMKPNGCRESCSGVNWSVSARLKPADGVACSSACQVARGQF